MTTMEQGSDSKRTQTKFLGPCYTISVTNIMYLQLYQIRERVHPGPILSAAEVRYIPGKDIRRVEACKVTSSKYSPYLRERDFLRDFLIQRQRFSINKINYSINPEWISLP